MKIRYLILLTLISSCSGFVEAGKVLRNEKVATTDEFLIEKKNPLTLPPEFSKLPEPRKNNEDEVSQDDNIDLTKVLETSDGLDEETLPSDLEKSIQNILKKK